MYSVLDRQQSEQEQDVSIFRNIQLPSVEDLTEGLLNPLTAHVGIVTLVEENISQSIYVFFLEANYVVYLFQLVVRELFCYGIQQTELSFRPTVCNSRPPVPTMHPRNL